MRLLDISTPISSNNPSDAPHQAPEITYLSHADNVPNMLKQFPGAAREDLPNGLGWATEVVKMTTHSGPHMDAPWHYAPTMNMGERALTIGEIPLEWCFSNGVKFDFSDRDPKVTLRSDDFKKQLEIMEYTLKPYDIVLLQSGAAPYFGKSNYRQMGVGVGEEATLWLIEQGVKVVGTDSFTWDRPFPIVAEEFQLTKDKNILWEGHYAGIKKGYCQMEKLTNLDLLPTYGFQVICFPIHIEGAGAGWIRAVAVLND